MRATTEEERTFAARNQLAAELSKELDDAGIWFFNIFGIPNDEDPNKGATVVETNIDKEDDLELLQRMRLRANTAFDELEKKLLEKKNGTGTSLPA